MPGTSDELSRDELREAARHLLEHPYYARRRVTVPVSQLTFLVTSYLVHRGTPASDLEGARWVWTSNEDGTPTLTIILPGQDS